MPIGALIGGFLGMGSQASANKANKEIAQMNNEWSEKMMDKQNQYNIAQWMRESEFTQMMADKANAFTEYMWNKTNDYNSAKNQAKRLREAGLNPALVMSGANAGSATGASGVQGATPSGNSVGLPSPSSATMQPLLGVGDLAGLLTASAQARKINAEADQLEASKDYMIAQARENLRGSKFLNDFNDDVREFRVGQENEQYLQAVTQRLLTSEQKNLVQQNIAYQRLVNANLPERLKQDIAVMSSQIELNRYNAKSKFEQLINSLEKRGYKLSKSEEKSIFEAVIGSIILEGTPDGFDSPKTFEYILNKWIK